MTNWTHRDRRVRRDVLVGVAYGSDTTLTKSLLLEAAAGYENVLGEPQPVVLFSSFGASSLDFTLRVWIDDFDHGLSVLSDLRNEIDQRFRRHGIEIAFPQRVVHLKNVAEFAAPFAQLAAPNKATSCTYDAKPRADPNERPRTAQRRLNIKNIIY